MSVLVCPVDLDLGIKDFSTIERVEGVLCSWNRLEFDKAVVEAAMLKVTVWNKFDANNCAEGGAGFPSIVNSDGLLAS